MKWGAGILLVAAVTFPGPARAQSMRLDPRLPDAAETHRVFQVVTVVRLAPDSAPPGPVTEYAYVGGLRVVALRGARAQTIMHLAFDSLRARARNPGGPWHERQVAGLDTLWTQLDMGDASAPVQRLGGHGPESTLLEDLLPCAPGLWIGVRDVRAGERWGVELAVPVSTGVVPLAGGSSGFAATGTLSVDSIVPRQRDTLAYLTLDAEIRRAPIREPDGARLIPQGTVRGRMVWSTGWKQCVSMAHRTAVGLTIEEPSGHRHAITVATTVRQAVVPSR